MKFPTASVVRHSRVLKDGSSALYLRATFRRKSKHFPLNLYAHPSEWDETAARFLRTHPHHKKHNDLLRTYEQRASDALLDFKRTNAAFSFDKFERAVFAPSAPVLTLSIVEYSRQVAAQLRTDGGEGNAARYESFALVVVAYNAKAALSEIDFAWLEKFERYLRGVRGNSDGGVAATMRTFRAVCNAAIKSGAPNDWYPFAGYTVKKTPTSGGSRALSMEDFRKIEAAEAGSQKEQFSKDVFCLSFYLRGANIADMAQLTEKNLVGGRIEYVRQKTKRTSPQRYSIPLSEEVREILARYVGQCPPYLLPIIRLTDRDSDRQIKRAINRAVKYCNEGLRALASKAGVDVSRLSTYSARHTGATALDAAGLSLTVIQQYLGHASPETTMHYLKKHGQEVLDEAGDLLRTLGK